MIAHALVGEIRRLLDEGVMSQRKIARRLGISRGTVHAIARGKRPDYLDRWDDVDDSPAPAGPPLRCPGCGGMVLMPCLLCRLRKGLGIGD
jgi:hypothetical protein